MKNPVYPFDEVHTILDHLACLEKDFTISREFLVHKGDEQQVLHAHCNVFVESEHKGVFLNHIVTVSFRKPSNPSNSMHKSEAMPYVEECFMLDFFKWLLERVPFGQQSKNHIRQFAKSATKTYAIEKEQLKYRDIDPSKMHLYIPQKIYTYDSSKLRLHSKSMT